LLPNPEIISLEWATLIPLAKTERLGSIRPGSGEGSVKGQRRPRKAIQFWLCGLN
jgi:hypothetical protein